MIAFIFPGQGSQQPGMGRPWVGHPSFELVEEASEILNRDIVDLLTEADMAHLQITRNTQIATFVGSMVALDAIERLGIAPQVCAGHSLGEYAALVAAGALSFEAGLRLVAERGEAMAIAADDSPGAMLALLGASIEQAQAICAQFPSDLWIANHNSETQIVLSGTLEAIAHVEERARDYGVRRATRLKVGGAFHSPYMLEAKDRLKKAIDTTRFYDLEVPVIANVDAREHLLAAEWPHLLGEQLTSPVQWERTSGYLRSLHPRLVIEVGAGGVLSNLLRRSAPEITVLSVSAPEDLENVLEAVTEKGPLHDWATAHHGERLYGAERLIVAPVGGVFSPVIDDSKPGFRIEVGQVVGAISNTQVRSPFAGELQGMVAVPGERVVIGQPLAWLRELPTEL
ncbi:MAG: ACP S-malonyltransferase [Ferrimicrobium sp.]